MSEWHNPLIVIDASGGGVATTTTVPKPIRSINIEKSIDRAIYKIPMVDGVLTQGDSKAGTIITVVGEVEGTDASTAMGTIDSLRTALGGNSETDNEFRFFIYYNATGYNRWYEQCVLQSFSYEPMTQIATRPWLTTAYEFSILAKDPNVYTDGSYAGGVGTYPTPAGPTYTTTCIMYGPFVIKGAFAIRNETSGNLVTRFTTTGSIFFTGNLENTATLS